MLLCMKQFVLSLAILGVTLNAYATGEAKESSEPTAVSSRTTQVANADDDANDKALLQRGTLIWMRCRSCHEAPSFVGPPLDGVFGRAAASKTAYVYSNALKISGLVWNAQTLDRFIKDPETYVPGTRMAFPGIPNQSDRNALIRYLKTK